MSGHAHLVTVVGDGDGLRRVFIGGVQFAELFAQRARAAGFTAHVERVEVGGVVPASWLPAISAAGLMTAACEAGAVKS